MLKLLKIVNHYKNKFLINIKNARNQVQWRLVNKHNSTSISENVKDLSLITVGKQTYGILDVISFGNPNEKLVIGNYVSIAGNVLFILGGNHQINAFSTFPIKSLLYQNEPTLDAQTNGAILVKDEVWIGNNVIIMSGISLGEGSIIAAGSVVTKDVSPYSIVGGNPAKFIKFRIPEELIEERIKFNYGNISYTNLSPEKLELLYKPLSKHILEDLNK